MLSEVFVGLLRSLHGARSYFDPSGIGRRGAWGSVTARNFPVALGHAFEKAIFEAYQGKNTGSL